MRARDVVGLYAGRFGFGVAWDKVWLLFFCLSRSPVDAWVDVLINLPTDLLPALSR